MDGWRKKPCIISVNISPYFFIIKNFISIIDNILSKIKINSKYISIEITENIALKVFEKERSY